MHSNVNILLCLFVGVYELKKRDAGRRQQRRVLNGNEAMATDFIIDFSVLCNLCHSLCCGAAANYRLKSFHSL